MRESIDFAVIYGAGGLGQILASSMKDTFDGINIAFVDDDQQDIGKDILGINVYREILDVPFYTKECPVYLAIGSNSARRQKAEQLLSVYPYLNMPYYVDCDARVSRHADIKNGTIILPGAVVDPSVEIGSFVIINKCVSVGHHSIIKNYAHICPGAKIGGNGTEIGEGAFLGLNSTILPGMKIGDWSKIGAGAVVIDDVPAGATTVGVPAKVVHRKTS